MIPAAVLVGLALFAVGFAVGWWRRDTMARAIDAMVREVREQSDRVIVVVLKEQARRAQEADEAKRARLYGRRAADLEPVRDTDAG